MSDAEETTRQYRLKCPNCKGIMICDETIVDKGGVCADCGTPVNVNAYASLRELIETKRAAELAAKEQREKERHERRLAEMEGKARAEEERRYQKQLDAMKRAEQQRLGELQVRDSAVQHAAAVIPTVPQYKALRILSLILGVIVSGGAQTQPLGGA